MGRESIEIPGNQLFLRILRSATCLWQRQTNVNAQYFRIRRVTGRNDEVLQGRGVSVVRCGFRGQFIMSTRRVSVVGDDVERSNLL